MKNIKTPITALLFLLVCLLFTTYFKRNEDGVRRVWNVNESRLSKLQTLWPLEKSKKFEHIDYDGFENLTEMLNGYRKERLVYIDDFKKLMNQKGTVLLDCRSKKAYDEIHIKGATHLNFSDFSSKKLEELFPDKDTKILIYCNNNFESEYDALNKKSETLALNIPTFINLYGYGYKNIYELYTPERIEPSDGELEYAGSIIDALKEQQEQKRVVISWKSLEK